MSDKFYIRQAKQALTNAGWELRLVSLKKLPSRDATSIEVALEYVQQAINELELLTEE